MIRNENGLVNVNDLKEHPLNEKLYPSLHIKLFVVRLRNYYMLPKPNIFQTNFILYVVTIKKLGYLE